MAKNPKSLTREEIDECKLLRSRGMSAAQIAKMYDVNPGTVMRAIDEEWAAKRREQVRVARMVRLRAEGKARLIEQDRYRPPAGDVAARLAEIPADTRNLTARIFGDPLPGRSALDRSVR